MPWLRSARSHLSAEIGTVDTFSSPTPLESPSSSHLQGLASVIFLYLVTLLFLDINVGCLAVSLGGWRTDVDAIRLMLLIRLENSSRRTLPIRTFSYRQASIESRHIVYRFKCARALITFNSIGNEQTIGNE